MRASEKTRQTREEQLVANAVELFSHGGYRETSLQEIADKLGITRPLFYYYFESKEELLWRIIGQLGDKLLEHARPIALAEAPAPEKLRQLLERHAETLLRNGDAFRIYFAERHLVQGKRDRRMRQGEDAYLGILSDVIADGQRSGDFRPGNPRLLAMFLTGMGNSILRWYVPSGALAPDEVSSLFADLGLAALRP